MFNIQKAVSRLNFAPKLNEIEITDIKNGIGVFKPRAEKPVSFTALNETLKKAGYTLASAKITVNGKLARDASGWLLLTDASGQRFALEGEDVDQALPDATPNAQVEVTGDWKTAVEGKEVITPLPAKKAEQSQNENGNNPARTEYVDVASGGLLEGEPLPVAPIRTTSPGLTVYRGGAFTPRYVYIKQQLGGLKVDRHIMLLSFSYTPTPKLLVEAGIPVTRISFKEGATSGGSEGVGNVIISGKYRFFRRVEAWGDRQAALRFGLELPTGQTGAPGEQQLRATAFVRQQLSPISGGLSPHLDLTYSQAKGRFIFGGNVEGVLRSERDGFRMGHELRINTDLEYVLFPRKYDRPGGEVFAILESNFIHLGTGRIAGAPAPGSRSTAYYLAPGVQYAMRPRFVIEASYQIPVARNTGPQVLRIERGLLVGVRILY
ncbi:MAG: transporter [Acidobacteria bacterium]|nr:transporter [Acidobacteriota bacterium]